VSQDPVFLAAPNLSNGGMLLINRKGAVMSATVNAPSVVSYIMGNLAHEPNAADIAFGLARRYGLPGAEDLFTQQFHQFFARGDYKNAARIAAQSKSDKLRSPEIIQQFQNAPQPPGQAGTPVLTYFSTLLEYGKLTALESIELVKPVVVQQRRDFIEKWLKEDKLECTEELGDLVKPLDTRLALSIYLRAEASPKVITCFVEQGQYEQILQYCRKVGYQADFSFLLRNMLMVNPDAACAFAKQLLEPVPGVGALMDINLVVELFMSQNRLQETTSILLDALKANDPSQASLQTKLLELNLMHNNIQVAEAIFQMNQFTHYDKKYIAQLCEKAGMSQRALEHYGSAQGGDARDVKRVLSNCQNLTPEFLVKYFSNLSPDVCLECLHDLIRNRQNLQPVVQVATTYHNEIGTDKLIEMFEQFQSWEGLFYFLGGIISTNQDKEVHLKYIQAAARLNHIQEVERICRESQVYDPVAVKDF